MGASTVTEDKVNLGPLPPTLTLFSVVAPGPPEVWGSMPGQTMAAPIPALEEDDRVLTEGGRSTLKLSLGSLDGLLVQRRFSGAPATSSDMAIGGELDPEGWPFNSNRAERRVERDLAETVGSFLGSVTAAEVVLAARLGLWRVELVVSLLRAQLVVGLLNVSFLMLTLVPPFLVDRRMLDFRATLPQWPLADFARLAGC